MDKQARALMQQLKPGQAIRTTDNIYLDCEDYIKFQSKLIQSFVKDLNNLVKENI